MKTVSPLSLDAGQAIDVRGVGPRFTASPRFMLLALVTVFALPFAIGSGLFWSGWRPETLRNHGELIQPPRALPPSVETLQGKWLLIVPARSGCTQACQDTLQQLQRVHAALGKNQGHVQRVVVRNATPFHLLPLEGEGDRALRTRDLLIISPATEDEAAWRHALDDYAPAVFIADPLGNLMMRYSEPIVPRSILRDMERLLKYSWVR